MPIGSQRTRAESQSDRTTSEHNETDYRKCKLLPQNLFCTFRMLAVRRLGVSRGRLPWLHVSRLHRALRRAPNAPPRPARDASRPGGTLFSSRKGERSTDRALGVVSPATCRFCLTEVCQPPAELSRATGAMAHGHQPIERIDRGRIPVGRPNEPRAGWMTGPPHRSNERPRDFRKEPSAEEGCASSAERPRTSRGRGMPTRAVARS